MTYIISEKRADLDVSMHPYAGEDGAGNFEYNTPSYIGLGVSRPNATTFRLAAGRHYLLFGAIAIRRSAIGSITYLETHFQWMESTTLYGKRGNIRANRGGTSLTANTDISIYRDPLYRREAVAFISDSVISAHSGTFDLNLVIQAELGSTTNTSYNEGAQPTDTAVIIMSIPA